MQAVINDVASFYIRQRPIGMTCCGVPCCQSCAENDLCCCIAGMKRFTIYNLAKKKQALIRVHETITCE